MFVNIKNEEIGLVYDKVGDIEKILTSGKHWNLKGKKIQIININEKLPIENNKGIISSYIAKKQITEVKIDIQLIGLVFINSKFKEILEAGNYYYWNREEEVRVYRYEKNGTYTLDTYLEMVMSSRETFEDINFKEYNLDANELLVLSKKSKVYDLMIGRNLVFIEDTKLEKQGTVITIPDDYIVSEDILKRIRTHNYIQENHVEPYEEALLIVKNKIIKTLEPGTYYTWNIDRNVKIHKIDKRIQPLVISGQDILTKDKISVRLNFIAQIKVVDIHKNYLNSTDSREQIYQDIQLLLREYIGTQELEELLESKKEINTYILERIVPLAEKVGIIVEEVGLKDIILPGDVKEILNTVLIAQKQSQANVIKRREETASTRSLLNTARLLDENKTLFKLKEMEFLEKISEKVDRIVLSGSGSITEQLGSIFKASDTDN